MSLLELQAEILRLKCDLAGVDALRAENEQLRAQITKAIDPAYLEEKLRQIGITDELAERALAERAGGVKVKVKGDAYRFVRNGEGFSTNGDERFASLSALEPAAPEGRQEAVTDEQRGAIAYALTKRLVIDMPTARAAVDEALAQKEEGR